MRMQGLDRGESVAGRKSNSMDRLYYKHVNGTVTKSRDVGATFVLRPGKGALLLLSEKPVAQSKLPIHPINT